MQRLWINRCILIRMTGRGRPHDPIPLKLLKGRGNGKDQDGYEVPAAPPFERGIPVPPEWLPDEGKELWARVAPTLDALALIKPEDREVFTTYCLCWSRLVSGQAVIAAEGLTIDNPKTGMPHKNPAVAIVEQATRDLARLAGEFGLTPRAEVALAKPAKDEAGDDPFAAQPESG